MLWFLLVGSGYGHYAGNDVTRTKRNIGALDPIDCAGQVDMRSLRASAFQRGFFYAVAILDIIMCPKVFSTVLNTALFPKERSLVFSTRKYQGHFDDLERWKILRKVEPEELSFCSSYFAVPKNDLQDRSIFNGRRLSELCTIPSSCNITDVRRLMKRFRDTNRQGRGYHIISGDLRHWFHQLPLNPGIQSYFGLAFSKLQCYVWRSLPMGWSYSPLIAQTTAWMALTHKEKGEFDYFDWQPSMENAPPTFVDIRHKDGRVVGWITIYYDNYILVSTDLSVAEALDARIQRNCARFNITIKEHFFQTRNSLTVEACKTLGLEIMFEVVKEYDETRKRSRQESFEMKWRLSEKKPHNPCQRKGGETIFTPKEIAATIGRILYARMIEGPLGKHVSTRATLKILSRISKAAWRMSWNQQCVSLSNEERGFLEEEWIHVETNPWRHENRPQSPATEIFVATDACDKGWAFCVMNSSGRIIRDSGEILFDESMKARHIYIKEMFAAVQGIKAAQMGQSAPVRVYLITDNTACAWGLKKGYSSNESAMEMMLEVNLENVEVITIPSAGNVADAPSRGRPTEEEKRAITWKVVGQYLKGRVDNESCSERVSYTKKGEQIQRVRHQEERCTDQSEESDNEDAFDEWTSGLCVDPEHQMP